MWWPPRLGEPLPRAAEAVGIHHKLETYSLVVDHGRGGDKALVFQRALELLEVTWIQGIRAVA